MAIETLHPTGEFGVSNHTGTYTNVDDLTSAPGSDWMDPTDDGTNTAVTFTFPTPSGALRSGAGLQTVKVYVRKQLTGGNNPSMTIAVRESGNATDLALLADGVTVSSETGVELTYTFDASVLADSSGANFELHIAGSRSGGNPNSRRSLSIGAVQWDADYASVNNYAYSGSGSISLTGAATTATGSGALNNEAYAGSGTVTLSGAATTQGPSSGVLGTIQSAIIPAGGTYVEITADGATTDYDALGDYSLDPDGTPKLTLDLTRPGYNSSGGAITVADTTIGLKPLRQVYPNEADLDVTDNGDGTVTIKVALSEPVFASDTSVTIGTLSGWITGGAANSGVTVTNNSALVYPKPIAQWATVGYQRITGDFDTEVVAWHRYGVQLVEVDCADQSSNNAAQQALTDEVWSTLPTRGDGFGGYKATIPVASLTQGDVLDCQFKVYPKIGDQTLDTRTTADGTAQPSSLLGPLHMLNDKSGTYGVTFAAVDGVGGGTPAVSTTEAGALANPYATIKAANDAIKAYNNTNHSRNDAGAGEIVLADGVNVEFASSAIATGNTDVWTIIRPENGGSATIGTGSGNVQSSGFFKIEGLTLSGSITGQFRGNNAVTSAIWFDNCSVNIQGTAASYQWGTRYVTNCDITHWDDFGGFGSGNRSVGKVIRGNDFNTAATTGELTGILPHCFIDNRGDWRISDNGPFLDDGVNYQVIAYNKNRGDQVGNASNIIELGSNDVDANAITTGLAIINNLIDPQSVSTPAAMGLFGDGTDKASENVLIWGNTIEGQRTNLAYNDTGNPVHKLWSIQYNTFDDLNIKSDVFAANGTYDNNWSVLFGSGVRGNNDEDAGSFQVEAALDHTTLVPGYTDQANDDYTPGANLNRGSGTHPLKYDIYGNLRNADLYAGAVTIQGGNLNAYVGSGTITLSGAATTAEGAGALNNNSYAGSGSVVFSGTAATASGAGALNNNAYAGTGTVSISGAATTGSSAGALNNSAYAGSGTVLVSGAATTASSAGSLNNASYAGTGTITLSGAATTGSSGSLNNYAYAGGGILSLTGTATTANGNGALNNGAYAGSGTVTFSGVATTASGTGALNNNSYAGTGTISITGAATTGSSGSLNNHAYVGSGVVTFSGVASTANGQGTLNNHNYGGAGGVTISGAAATSSGAGATSNRNYSGSGQITITGAAITSQGDAGNNHEYVGGGTITLVGAATTSLTAGSLNNNGYAGSGALIFSGAAGTTWSAGPLNTASYSGSGDLFVSGSALTTWSGLVLPAARTIAVSNRFVEVGVTTQGRRILVDIQERNI